jgi:hypothetical protein
MKGEIMKKLISLLLPVLVFVAPAGADSITEKFRIINHVTRFETMNPEDEKGHFIGILTRSGLALFEDGQIGNQSAMIVFDMISGKSGSFQTYTTIILEDGSSWIAKSNGKMARTPDGKRLLTKQAGDIVSGTGKYEGIKGTIAFEGVQYGPTEVGKGDWVGDCTITYNVSRN